MGTVIQDFSQNRHKARQFTGDQQFVEEWWPNMMLALRWFSAYENKDGLLEDVPYWSFIDWGEGPEGPVLDDRRGGIVTPLNLQYLEALQVAADFAAQLSDDEAKTHYSSKAERLSQEIQKQLWDERKGVYADCRVNGVLSEIFSEPTNALAVLHLHEAGHERLQRIFRTVFSQESHAVAGSPYFMLVIFRALMKLGQRRRALELMRMRYGKLLLILPTVTGELQVAIDSDQDGRRKLHVDIPASCTGIIDGQTLPPGKHVLDLSQVR